MIIIVKKTENIKNQKNAIYPFPREGLFWHISGAHNHIPNESNMFNLNGLNRRDKISFGANALSKHPIPNSFVRKIIR